MLLFPNCKINLGLQVVGKRPDGYHDIESVFFPVPWHDALEIVEAPELSLTVSGNSIPGDPQKNLCIQAWHLLRHHFPDLPPVAIYLHKTIPAGAGLGGGSSNGAFMLKALNDFFGLGLSQQHLMDFALQMGSDCPFFIPNNPALARGRGELLEPVPLDLKGNTLVLINPGIHVHTGWAFGQIKPAPSNLNWQEIIGQPVHQWADLGLTNVFQPPVFARYPEISRVHDLLMASGAQYASMSGTGSTCYGIFSTDTNDWEALCRPGWLFRKLEL